MDELTPMEEKANLALSRGMMDSLKAAIDEAYVEAQKTPHGTEKAFLQGIYIGLRKAEEIIMKEMKCQSTSSVG